MEDVIPREPWLFNLRSSKQLIGLAVFSTTFTDGFLYGIIVSVLPFSLTVRSGVPEADVPFWTSTSLAVFGLAMVLGAPMAGWIVGKCERRQIPFLGGLSCAFGATVLFMLGVKLWMIIVARIFQGLSASVVYTAGLTLLVDTIESHELGPWIGFGLSGMNFGVLVSPTLGGIVYEKAGFYLVFIMGLGVVLINLILILLMIDRKTAEKLRGRNGSTGSSFLPNGSSTKSAIANGKGRLSTVEDSDLPVTTPLLSHYHETSSPVAKHPTWWTIVGGFLRNHCILAALYGCLINTILVSAMDAVLPIFVKRTFHWFSGATGAMFLNITIPSFIGPFVGMISDKYGVRLISTLGFTLGAVAVALLAFIQHDDTTNKAMACVLLFFVGIGLNTSLTPLVTEIPRIVNVLQEEQPDVYGDKSTVTEAYMLLDAAFGAGTVLGPLLSELAFETLGWTGCTVMLAFLTASAIIPVVVHLPPKPKGTYTVS
ncbi:Major facilitator superfamily domain general substrate transporter [Penicillium cf. griseofulvum]|uniref:Major facilitator superfamily domain general substrate transporter n=1 Tax=Penicillium cf. griseofulvum TaxID=2972120 RepID=A0A9W9JTD0_9EURO|nr:Major facilitator superfamily domain general substrate transporter [Penicillium cf. griseofulvum]KAJ5423838.1 Major facilitator superfamily domain general substrate transporter [Penicillium cf. griseofulvum]KAJ5430908.1 Major facilitator superfamily domain general substrate transporter [Penicillium cf. griseofulvum]